MLLTLSTSSDSTSDDHRSSDDCRQTQFLVECQRHVQWIISRSIENVLVHPASKDKISKMKKTSIPAKNDLKQIFDYIAKDSNNRTDKFPDLILNCHPSK